MNAIPLLRANTMLPFVKFLNQIGSPTERLLQQARLPLFALDDPEALLPVYQTLNFVEQAAQLETIETLGVLVGQQTEVADMGMFGQMLHQTLTLYHLLTTIEQMISTLNSSQRIWLTERGDDIWLNQHLLCPSTVKNEQATLYGLMLYLKAVRLAAGPDWQPAELYLQCNYSRALVAMKEFANIPLRFNQANTAFAIPKALLSLPLRPVRMTQALPVQDLSVQDLSVQDLSVQDLSVQDLSVQDYCQRLQTTAPATDFSSSLQQLLQTLLKDGYPDIHWAAEASGLSVRSLQRRLAEINLSYSQVVEQVRFDQAMQCLYKPEMPLVEIALELGYNDAANFTRAFKRWTGVSPREFRHLHVKPKK